MGVIKEFREFAVKGNVIDMAVGIIIGGAFGTVVKSLVTDVIMPPVGLLIGGVDFNDLYVLLREGATAAPYESLAAAQEAGAVTLNVGLFINNVISFLIVGFAVFLLVRTINRIKREEPTPEPAPTEKPCPFCKSNILIEATRCPNCTSQIEAA